MLSSLLLQFKQAIHIHWLLPSCGSFIGGKKLGMIIRDNFGLAYKPFVEDTQPGFARWALVVIRHIGTMPAFSRYSEFACFDEPILFVVPPSLCSRVRYLVSDSFLRYGPKSW